MDNGAKKKLSRYCILGVKVEVNWSNKYDLLEIGLAVIAEWTELLGLFE